MFEQAFKNIDDVLWKEAGCTTELDYTEQTSWILFLKYLDGLEADLADQAALEGRTYPYILEPPYRWEAWASPSVLARTARSTVEAACASGSCSQTLTTSQPSAVSASVTSRSRPRLRCSLGSQ